MPAQMLVPREGFEPSKPVRAADLQSAGDHHPTSLGIFSTDQKKFLQFIDAPNKFVFIVGRIGVLISDQPALRKRVEPNSDLGEIRTHENRLDRPAP